MSLQLGLTLRQGETKRYTALDPKTQLVHIVDEFDAGLYTDAVTVHATLCDIEVDKEWKRYPTPMVVSCLQCLALEDD
jgi:hypothetical protein